MSQAEILERFLESAKKNGNSDLTNLSMEWAENLVRELFVTGDPRKVFLRQAAVLDVSVSDLGGILACLFVASVEKAYGPMLDRNTMSA